MLQLGYQIPVQRVIETKERDSERQWISGLFNTWDEKHGEQPVKVDKLDPKVKRLLDPNKSSRQNIANVLKGLEGTRLEGFVLTRHKPSGKWSPATYALKRTEEGTETGAANKAYGPDAPYGPYGPYA